MRYIACAWAIFYPDLNEQRPGGRCGTSRFDCTKVVQPFENVICEDAGLAELDWRMADKFQKGRNSTLGCDLISDVTRNAQIEPKA